MYDVFKQLLQDLASNNQSRLLRHYKNFIIINICMLLTCHFRFHIPTFIYMYILLVQLLKILLTLQEIMFGFAHIQLLNYQDSSQQNSSIQSGQGEAAITDLLQQANINQENNNAEIAQQQSQSQYSQQYYSDQQTDFYNAIMFLEISQQSKILFRKLFIIFLVMFATYHFVNKKIIFKFLCLAINIYTIYRGSAIFQIIMENQEPTVKNYQFRFLNREYSVSKFRIIGLCFIMGSILMYYWTKHWLCNNLVICIFLQVILFDVFRLFVQRRRLQILIFVCFYYIATLFVGEIIQDIASQINFPYKMLFPYVNSKNVIKKCSLPLLFMIFLGYVSNLSGLFDHFEVGLERIQLPAQFNKKFMAAFTILFTIAYLIRFYLYKSSNVFALVILPICTAMLIFQALKAGVLALLRFIDGEIEDMQQIYAQEEVD